MIEVFSAQTSSNLSEPCWENALLLCSELSCGEYANEVEKHLLFWLATSWLSCRQRPCIDCLVKLYCCLKNYQALTDCAGYNWAAHSESWGEDLQATETVHKSWVNVGGAEAKLILAWENAETLDPFLLINEEISYSVLHLWVQENALIQVNKISSLGCAASHGR